MFLARVTSCYILAFVSLGFTWNSCDEYYQDHVPKIDRGLKPRLEGPEPGARSEWLWKVAIGQQLCRRNFNDSIYKDSLLSWTQTNYVTNQMHPMDRYFWNNDRGEYTVERFLEDSRSRFGGLDSLLIWPTYPNLGIDHRNQLEMYQSLPRGIQGLTEVIEKLHQERVRVLLAYTSWDANLSLANQTDQATIGAFVSEVGADGLNLDICKGVQDDACKHHPLSFSDCPHCAFESEGYTNFASREMQTLAWADGWALNEAPSKPAADIVKLSLDSRWMSMGQDRGSDNYTQLLHMMVFNGVGFTAWENVWGDFHKMTAHDAELCRRASAILRYFGHQGFLQNSQWMPFADDVISDIVHGTRFPSGKDLLYLLVNSVGRASTAVLMLQKTMRAYDCYHGRNLDTRAQKYIEIDVEALGIGCVFFTAHAPGDFSSFLSRMRNMTEKPLQTYSQMPSPLEMRMWHHISSRKARKSNSSNMVLLKASIFFFKVDVISCEAGLIQFPWETAAVRQVDSDRHHEHHIALQSFYIDKFPVTNSEYAKYLENTGYSPQDKTNWLKTWHHNSTVPRVPKHHGAKAVTWVNLQEAIDYCQWRGGRLPQSYEWQYAAQSSLGRLFPWGNNTGEAGVEFPEPSSDRFDDVPSDVTAHTRGCTPDGICDLVGNVWQYTDVFETERMLQYVVRGGSRYSSFQALRNKHGEGSRYYFPCPDSDQATRLDTMSVVIGMGNASYERSGMVGFRCVADLATDTVLHV